ncbi:glycosyltransferase [bacterium]|nr:glycosyltransferase [bacterium]
MHLSVITATRDRPQQLASCLQHFRRQIHPGIDCEQIVVADGPDPRAEALASEAGARFYFREIPGGAFGAAAKDLGIQQAIGDYVCFWDDDNWYEPYALLTLYQAAVGYDIGVVQIRHLNRKTGQFRTLPEPWTGTFELGNVDTQCICVRRTVAKTTTWAHPEYPKHTDYHWLVRLSNMNPSIRFNSVIIGLHL